MPSRAYVSAFGFKGPDQQKPAGVLSGGERNRLNLALTLKQGGNLLLLDEPTNDLDVETLSSLENALLDFPGCAVVVSPRPVVPRPGGDAHPRLRGRLPVVLVRGQLRVVREEQGRAARRRTPRVRTARPTASSPAAEPAVRHRYRCPLRWSDMDAYGHVNNVVYLTLPGGGAGRHALRAQRGVRRQGAVRGRPGRAPRDRLQAAARLPPPRRRHRDVGRLDQGRVLRDPLRGARRDDGLRPGRDRCSCPTTWRRSGRAG